MERALAPLGEEHREPLWAIVSDAAVMEGVGDTRPWDRAKLGRFLQYCAREETEAPPRRRFYYWGVFVGGTLAGVVGIHPITYDPPARGWDFLTIFLAKGAENRGTGTWAAREALGRFWGLRPGAPVYIDTRTGNAAMVALARKLGALPAERAPYLRRRAYARFCVAQPEKRGP